MLLSSSDSRVRLWRITLFVFHLDHWSSFGNALPFSLSFFLFISSLSPSSHILFLSRFSFDPFCFCFLYRSSSSLYFVFIILAHMRIIWRLKMLIHWTNRYHRSAIQLFTDKMSLIITAWQKPFISCRLKVESQDRSTLSWCRVNLDQSIYTDN